MHRNIGLQIVDFLLTNNPAACRRAASAGVAEAVVAAFSAPGVDSSVAVTILARLSTEQGCTGRLVSAGAVEAVIRCLAAETDPLPAEGKLTACFVTLFNLLKLGDRRGTASRLAASGGFSLLAGITEKALAAAGTGTQSALGAPLPDLLPVVCETIFRSTMCIFDAGTRPSLQVRLDHPRRVLS